MTREEAIEVLQTALTAPFIYGKYAEALDMAIESLSAEQKEEELAKDIARRMATIIENEQDMRVILKNASAEPTVIRCRTLLTDEDFKMVAKQIRETNQNVIVIPCEAEVVSTETSTETSTDLISREEAIDSIYEHEFSNWCDKDEVSTILNDLPSVPEKLQPRVETSDLISRADAIEAVENLQTEQWIDSDIDYNNGLQSAIAEIKALPSADRPTGEWIKHNDSCTIIFYYTCSECGEVESGTPPYCRNCGAKMGSDTR